MAEVHSTRGIITDEAPPSPMKEHRATIVEAHELASVESREAPFRTRNASARSRLQHCGIDREAGRCAVGIAQRGRGAPELHTEVCVPLIIVVEHAAVSTHERKASPHRPDVGCRGAPAHAASMAAATRESQHRHGVDPDTY